MPKAKKAAQRSSTILYALISGCSENPMVSGALRDPGEITTLVIPLEIQSATTDCATGILEYFMSHKNTKILGIINATRL